MEITSRICLAEVQEYLNGELKKQYTDIFDSKEEAVRFCTETVKKRYCEIKQVDVVTEEDLFEFMNDESWYFKLTVTECSRNRRKYELYGGSSMDFWELVDNPEIDLYDKLLALVNHNYFVYDYFGNLLDNLTESQGGFSNDPTGFTEEECTDKYHGRFQYYRSDSRASGYHIPKQYYFMEREIYREPTGKDHGYSCYVTEMESLDDLMETAISSLFWDMHKYYTRMDGDDDWEITDIIVLFFSVAIVLGKL